MSLTIIGRNGIVEFKYLENRHAEMDFYRVIKNTPAVKIERLSHQLPPKGWWTPTHPKIIPKPRQSKREKKEPKRLGNLIPTNIIKFVKL